MDKFIFKHDEPAHKRYGYGGLAVDSMVEVAVADRREAAKIRAGVNAHAQYYGKKYRTAVRDGVMYIKRIA